MELIRSMTAGAGDVDIVHADGHVELKCSSGDIRIGRIDGTATIKNSNGDVSIRDITSDLRVLTANGNVVVDRARASVVLKNSNGNVRLGEAGRGTVVAETACGDIDVAILEGIAAWLDLTTASGKVRTDLDSAGPPAPGADTVKVRGRTAYGDITIRRAPLTRRSTWHRPDHHDTHRHGRGGLRRSRMPRSPSLSQHRGIDDEVAERLDRGHVRGSEQTVRFHEDSHLALAAGLVRHTTDVHDAVHGSVRGYRPPTRRRAGTPVRMATR